MCISELKLELDINDTGKIMYTLTANINPVIDRVLWEFGSRRRF